jgi:hypothetical protein
VANDNQSSIVCNDGNTISINGDITFSPALTIPLANEIVASDS